MKLKGGQLAVVVIISCWMIHGAWAGQQPACTGWIAVESAPVENGAIVLDGKKTGKSAPTTLKGVPCGSHTVEVSLPEHASSKVKVKVQDGEIVKAAVDLRPNFAPLEITTKPVGAKLVLNGKQLGKSPFKLQKATGGEHTLVATLPDYHPETRKFTLRPGKALKLSLVLKPAFGSLTITAKPEPEANIILDGDALGTTPITLSRILAGVHTVRVEKAGYLPFKKKIKVREGKEFELNAILKPNFGTLNLTSAPKGAKITVDGKDHGVTPASIRLSPGEHQVVVAGTQAASGKVSKTVKIRLRKKHKLHVRIPMRTGNLMVDTIPFAAGIELDGKKMGKAPLSLKKIPIGTHVLVATVKGKPPLIGRIDVIEGKTATSEMNLNDPNKSVYNSGGPLPASAKPAEKPKPVPKPLAEPKPEPEMVAKARKETGPGYRKKPEAKPGEEPKPEPKIADKSGKSGPPSPGKRVAEDGPVSKSPPTVAKSRPMSTQRLLAWISTGTGGAAALTSVILFAARASVQNDADEAWDNGDRNKARDLDAKAANLGTGGWIVLGAAAAFGGAAVYFFLTEPDPGERTAVRFTPLPGGGWVGLEGRF